MTIVRTIFAKVTQFAAYAGLTAYGSGSAWSLIGGDADLFHRFGALGVAASFLFFSDRLTKIELGRQRSVERLLHEYGVELAAMRQGKNATEIPPEGYAVDFLTEERNFGALRRQAGLFNFMNVLLMTASTLQWGFGDRFVWHLLGCGAAPC